MMFTGLESAEVKRLTKATDLEFSSWCMIYSSSAICTDDSQTGWKTG